MQPVRDHGEGWTLFFIAFMVVGSFFIINLFVGVVIDNFNRMKEEMGEDMWLTEAQREWVRTQELMLHIKPQKQFEPPAAPARKIAFRVVNSNIFEVQHQSNTHTHTHSRVPCTDHATPLLSTTCCQGFIMACIFANTLVMSMEFFGMDEGYASFLATANLGFAILFNIEAAIKLYGLGLQYFRGMSCHPHHSTSSVFVMHLTLRGACRQLEPI